MSNDTTDPVALAREVLDAAHLLDNTPGTLYLDGPTPEYEEAVNTILDAAATLARAALTASGHKDPRPRHSFRIKKRPTGWTLWLIHADGQTRRHGTFRTWRAALDAAEWIDRRIPAPTPPAEEVELPGVPCVLTDVRIREALATGVALWTGLEAATAGFHGRAVAHPAQALTAFTLPDGTRARRDGNHANGEPRFIKAREGEA